MPLLDSYFNHLQSRTGADCFVMVRDDALNVSTRSEGSNCSEIISETSLSVQTSPVEQRSRRKPKFQPETLDYNPPCPPKRLGSEDDLAVCRRSGYKMFN